jgi:hypothetical protein
MPYLWIFGLRFDKIIYISGSSNFSVPMSPASLGNFEAIETAGPYARSACAFGTASLTGQNLRHAANEQKAPWRIAPFVSIEEIVILLMSKLEPFGHA